MHALLPENSVVKPWSLIHAAFASFILFSSSKTILHTFKFLCGNLLLLLPIVKSFECPAYATVGLVQHHGMLATRTSSGTTPTCDIDAGKGSFC